MVSPSLTEYLCSPGAGRSISTEFEESRRNTRRRECHHNQIVLPSEWRPELPMCMSPEPSNNGVEWASYADRFHARPVSVLAINAKFHDTHFAGALPPPPGLLWDFRDRASGEIDRFLIIRRESGIRAMWYASSRLSDCAGTFVCESAQARFLRRSR